MLSTSEFEAWCRQLNLNDYTQQIIAQIRISKPSRAVQGGRSNVCGTYPSQKMGVTIQFELCNTLSTQQLQDIASIVVNALYNKI
jgi:putative transposase